MNFIKIINIILIICISIIGIETIIRIKKSKDKSLEKIKKSLLFRINIIIVLTFLIAFFSIILIILNNTPKRIVGIENYNKNYYIKEYGGDLDSNLSIFPDSKDKFIEASFSSSMRTYLFDTDGYILLIARYNNEDFKDEITRLKSLSMNIKSSCYDKYSVYTNYVKYDDISYRYPAYITIDGFKSTYEYALIDENGKKIIYVYLSYPDNDNYSYKKYLKIDKSSYSKIETLDLYSMYNHSFDNGKTYMEFGDCTDKK